MNKSIVFYILFMNLIFWYLLQSPMYMSLNLILFSIFIAFWMFSSTSNWLSYMIILIFLGGVMVMFMYIVSLSNQMKKIKLNFNLILMFLFLSLPNLLFSYMNLNFQSNFMKFLLMKAIYLLPSMKLLLLLIIYLLASLFIMVMLVEYYKGPFTTNINE